MKKILIVFGTRPEAIKMAPMVKEFQKHPYRFETVVCVTAQHREMLDQVLRIFDIVPDIDLNIMQAGQDLTDVTTRVLTGMRDVLKETKPDIVLVHGDTTTSSATALAAFYQQIPVGHVEAGLRTHDIYSPWPEEINRQIIGRMVLITGHRRENFGEGFINICEAIRDLALMHSDVDFVYPMHLNPNVRSAIQAAFGDLDNQTTRQPDNIFFIEPLEYLPFVHLMQKCTLVLTDSGGIQEEAPGLGKPVLVMRNTTERPEGITAGTVTLTGTDRQTIINEVNKLLVDNNYYKIMSEAVNPYGDGKASERITKKLSHDC